jgi:hypothetical protein
MLCSGQKARNNLPNAVDMTACKELQPKHTQVTASSVGDNVSWANHMI